MAFPGQLESKTSRLPSPPAHGYDGLMEKDEAKQDFKDQRGKVTRRATPQQENRVGKKLVGAYISKDMAQQLKAKAASQGTTIQHVVEKLLALYLEEPADPKPILKNYRKNLQR